MATSSTLAVRPLQPKDLDRVVEIDAELVGRARRGFFQKRLEAALAYPEAYLADAVEEGGTLLGYALCRIQTGEFGVDHPVAVLDVIGVAPAGQGKGVGRMLMDGLDAQLKKRGVKEMRTQEFWTSHALIRFFDAAGFSLANQLVLERSTAPLMR